MKNINKITIENLTIKSFASTFKVEIKAYQYAGGGSKGFEIWVLEQTPVIQYGVVYHTCRTVYHYFCPSLAHIQAKRDEWVAKLS